LLRGWEFASLLNTGHSDQVNLNWSVKMPKWESLSLKGDCEDNSKKWSLFGSHSFSHRTLAFAEIAIHLSLFQFLARYLFLFVFDGR